MLRNLLDKMKLPFRKERELLSKLYDVLGFYPKNVKYYRQALTHKSQRGRDKDGQRQQHNERLEYLGDAIIGAIVSDVMYHRFPKKGEGFLTNTRSKVVQRESLNRLADQLGVTKLVRVGKGATDHAHNIGGNALEALVGAIYLDRGYNACRQFIHLRIVKSLGDLNDLAMREINYKSKLIEWAQKNRFVVQFPNLPESERVDENNTFVTGVTVEGIHIAKGEGTNKKESHQRAAFTAWERIQNEGKLKDRIIDAHKKRRKQEDENNTATVPGLQRSQDDTAIRAEQRRRSKGKQQEQHANDTKVQQALEQPKPEVQQQAKPEQKQRAEQHKAEVEVQQQAKPEQKQRAEQHKAEVEVQQQTKPEQKQRAEQYKAEVEVQQQTKPEQKQRVEQYKAEVEVQQQAKPEQKQRAEQYKAEVEVQQQTKPEQKQASKPKRIVATIAPEITPEPIMEHPQISTELSTPQPEASTTHTTETKPAIATLLHALQEAAPATEVSPLPTTHSEQRSTPAQPKASKATEKAATKPAIATLITALQKTDTTTEPNFLITEDLTTSEDNELSSEADNATAQAVDLELDLQASVTRQPRQSRQSRRNTSDRRRSTSKSKTNEAAVTTPTETPQHRQRQYQHRGRVARAQRRPRHNNSGTPADS